MKGLVKITLARSLFVAAAFTITAFVMVFFGLVPERSATDWVYVGLILLVLSLLSGLTVTYLEEHIR